MQCLRAYFPVRCRTTPASGRPSVFDTRKIFDACKDKDCIEDLRFYPTQDSQCAIDRAVSIKAGKAELLYVYIDVEPIGFNRGFYTVDVRYYYRVTADAFVGAVRPVEISGLCVFDKRVILFGSESSAKVFTSQAVSEGPDQQMRKCSVPTAVVGRRGPHRAEYEAGGRVRVPPLRL